MYELTYNVIIGPLYTWLDNLTIYFQYGNGMVKPIHSSFMVV